MFRAKKLLLGLIVGSVWISGADSTNAADAEAKSGGYLTEAGAVWVKQESGVAVLTPPWDAVNLSVLKLRFESSSANVWWYRVPDQDIYFGLDHRGHDCPAVFVWIYYRDQADHWQLRHYWARVRGIADSDEAGLPGGAADGWVKPAKPMTDEVMPAPDMSTPNDGPAAPVPPPDDFRLFPEEPAPGTGGADDASPPDDFFQPAPPTAPENDATPPFSGGLVPPGSP